jgi:membrane protein YqaA with SNARE-associated domain
MEIPISVPVPVSDGIRIRNWLGFYVLFLVACLLAIVLLPDRSGEAWRDWTLVWQNFREVVHGHGQPRPTWHDCAESFQRAFNITAPTIKLLVVVIYLSMATTLTPLPTGWVVAGMATQGAAIASNVWSVTLIVGLAGALGSTVANMNDYYFWTWLLRSRRVAKVRSARWYAASAKWFSRSPFMILTIFNLIPIPVDVIRLLAISYRYSRLKFAAANFLGRFVRYGVFAFVTYWFHLGWIAPVALLALAVVLGIVKMLHSAWQRVRPAASD